MTRRLITNERGSAIIEIAVALPALIILMWTIVQAGLVYRAMSGIQHGLGEGARYATLYPQPTTDAIKNKITATVYGIGPGSFTIASPVSGTLDGGKYLDLKVTYSQATDLLIIPGPTVSVSRSKRVWVN
ncbi:MAG: TadE family protein [Pseudomonadota bacterium]